MKTQHLRAQLLLFVGLFLSCNVSAQVPVADFSIAPTPICTGSFNVYQISDQSTGSPSAWSYTVRGGFGPGGNTNTFTVQNPTVSFTGQGTYTISLVASNAAGQSVVVSKTITVLQSPNANINPQTASTCVGGSPVTIQVQTGGGPGGGGNFTYNWSNGASTNSISVSPSVTTVFTCVITSTNGCSSLRTATVNIGNPVVNITSVPASICPGTTSTLSATSSGPAPYAYLWSDNTLNPSTTASVSGVVTVTVTNAQGCSNVATYSLGTSTTLSLTAGSTPTALCSGNTAVLNVSGASSYTWSTGATQSNATVNPTSNTTYTVVGQIGTCTGSAAVTLSVSNLPTVSVVSNPPSVCAGQPATLTASGAASFTWQPGNVVSSTFVVVPQATSNYSVRGQNPGCPARNGTINLSVLPKPVVTVLTSNTQICAGEALALTAFGAASYSWSTGATGAVIIVYPQAGAVTYSVTGTTNACSTNTNVALTVMECAGLHSNATLEQLLVYPNPSSGMVNLQGNQETDLQVLSLTGRLLLHAQLNAGNNYQVFVADLPKGLYLVNYTVAGKLHCTKLLVQ